MKTHTKGGALTATLPIERVGMSDRFKAAFIGKGEFEFASVLDELGVPWEYENEMIILEANPDGTPKLATIPDFGINIGDGLKIYFEVTATRKPDRVPRKLMKIERAWELGEVIVLILPARLAEIQANPLILLDFIEFATFLRLSRAN